MKMETLKAMNVGKRKALVLQADGKARRVKPANGKTFQLHEAQSLVGGFIEVVHLGESTIMVVNEEGKITGLPINVAATEILRAYWEARNYHTNDYIAGDAVLMHANMLP